MATTKITYNGNEISSTDETAPVSITYGGSTIVSVEEGESKTLNCNGLYMDTNLVVGSKTLLCANKIMASSVGIEVVGSTEVRETWQWNYNFSAFEGYTGEFESNGITFNSMNIDSPTFRYIDLYYDSTYACRLNVQKSTLTWYGSYQTFTLVNPDHNDYNYQFLISLCTRIS